MELMLLHHLNASAEIDVTDGSKIISLIFDGTCVPSL